MPSERVERRLVAILATDMVGFSRLVEMDEEGTLARQAAHRREIFDPGIAEHHGRIVKSTGDGLLVEFASAVDAVRCAAEIQRTMAEREADQPEDHRIAYRVGINVGDIVIEGEDILGDGVNVAARLEGLAEPGGICMSGAVYEHVAGKVAVECEDLGEQRIKNIAKPVRVYRVRLDPAAASAAAVLRQVDAPTIPRDRPSIAVLPFDNMSGDPEQEYFVDGITEDIITTLSKISHLMVIARTSTFTYKGQRVDAKEVGRKLGVAYVLEGSARKAANRVRITAQLIDTVTGTHAWADRYDRDLEDVFAVQDEITQEIVTALEVKLSEGEQVRTWRRDAASPEAYEHFSRGRDIYFTFSRAGMAQAKQEFQRAIEINPGFSTAYAHLGDAYVNDARFGWDPDRAAALEKARELAQKALALDPDNTTAHRVLGYAAMVDKDFDEAASRMERAVASSPSNADAYHMLAMARLYDGEFAEGARLEQQSLRLNPLAREISLVELGRAYFHMGRFDDAITVLERAAQGKPKWLTARTLLAACYGENGRGEAAEREVAEILRISPKFSLARMAEMQLYRRKEDLDRFIDSLRKLGLPE